MRACLGRLASSGGDERGGVSRRNGAREDAPSEPVYGLAARWW